jgi:hypothetical protein
VRNAGFITPELLNDETFSFSVEVSDGKLSNIVAIDISLAANTTEKTVKESKKSGGSVNWFMIALLGLVAFSRRFVHLLKWNR